MDAVAYRGCDPLHLDMIIVPFGDSSYLTGEVRIQNMESRVKTSFVIVKGGLDSGTLTTNYEF